MADFTKFKIGSTSYNVKDPNAGRSLNQPTKGNLTLNSASGAVLDTEELNLDGSLADVTIDPQTLADGDVVTYDANTNEWINKPAGGGGGSGSVQSYIMYSSYATLSNLLTTSQVSISIDDVFVDGTTGSSIAQLVDAIQRALTIDRTIDIKLSIKGQDFTADVISYYIDNAGTVYIIFSVVDYQQGRTYKKFTSFDMYASGLTIQHSQTA